MSMKKTARLPYICVPILIEIDIASCMEDNNHPLSTFHDHSDIRIRLHT